MNTLNTLSADRLVHLIFEQNGQRTFFNRTDRKRDDGTGIWYTIPVVGTEARESNPMTLEMALISQRRWKAIGIECRFVLEPNGPLVDAGPKSEDSLPWPHADVLVTCDEQGNLFDSIDAPCVFLIRAVNTPQGKMFCLRSDHPSLAEPSVFATLEEGPEHCVEKARSLGFRHKPIVNPYLESRRIEAERRGTRSQRPVQYIRPGDRT
jgi:hypothetical protein